MQQQVQVSRVFPDGDCEVFVRRESACSGDCHKCSGCGAQAQQVFVRAENAIGAQPGDKSVMDVIEALKNAIDVYYSTK